MPSGMYSSNIEVRKKISATLIKKGIRPPSRKGLCCSEETKRKIGDANRGENSYRWKGGTNRLSNCKVCNKKLATLKATYCRKHCIILISGSKSHLWRGGITPINTKIRQSLEYKLWRETIFKRDNWTCISCGVKGSRSSPIQADHIKPFSLFPELRFAIDNGRTLCVDCHKNTDTYGLNARYIKK